MKRKLFYVVLAFVSIMVQAQQAGNYLADKIPGFRSRTEIVNFLYSEGFVAKNDTFYTGIGEYRGHEVRFSTDVDKLLRQMEVRIPVKGKEWQEIYGAYLRMKERFITHHGAPLRIQEIFRSEIYPVSDKEKLAELRNGNCDYLSTFTIRHDLQADVRLAQYGDKGTYLHIKFNDLGTGVHLKFMQIPIDGPSDPFVKELVGKGFNLTHRAEGCATLNGTFAGFENCDIYVLENNKTKNVKSILVSFPHTQEWESIMQVYSPLADMLKQKYGEPTSESGAYGLNNAPDSPASELENIAEGRADYHVTFRKEEGVIALSIRPSMKVVLLYGDEQNKEIETKQPIDDL